MDIVSDTVVFAIDRGLGAPGPMETDERVVRPTTVGAEAGGSTTGLPVDFEGTPGAVAPPFPSLGNITVEVAKVEDREV